MGVEPTDACCSQPPTDFEDQGRHRATSTPIDYFLATITIFHKLKYIVPSAQRVQVRWDMTHHFQYNKWIISH